MNLVRFLPASATISQQVNDLQRVIPAAGGIPHPFVSGLVLLCVGLVLPGSAVGGPPRPTADMQPAEIRALWLFDSEAGKAAKDLAVERPRVVFVRDPSPFPFTVPPTTAAFVWPDQRVRVVVVLPRALAWRDRQVRCFARHELAHLKLGHHGARTREVLEQHHQEVEALLAATWGEDSSCR